MNMDWLNAHDLSVGVATYDLVYTPLPETGSIDGRLHKLFEQFNFTARQTSTAIHRVSATSLR